MALYKCPKCGYEISESALSCPKCGHLTTNANILLIVLFLQITLITCLIIFDKLPHAIETILRL